LGYAPQLGYNGDPNYATGTTSGQILIKNCPTGSRYQEDDGTQWYKKTAPNVWAQFGTGTGGSFTGGTVNGDINVNGGITGTTLTLTLPATGSPMTIASDVKVVNLNADLLDGTHASGFTSTSTFSSYTGYTAELLKGKFDNTGGTINGNLTIESGYTISGDGSGLTNIPASAVTIDTIQFGVNTAQMTAGGLVINTGVTIDGALVSVGSTKMVSSLNANYLSGKTASDFASSDHVHDQYSQTGHTHYQLYDPTGGTIPVVYVDAARNVHIDGDIIQQGTGYITTTEQIVSMSDYIYLRSGATGSLPTTGFTGFEVIKYDGTTNARMVFDYRGVAKVGDVGDEQPIVTRGTGMTNNNVTYWKDGKLETSDISINNIGTNVGTSVNGGVFIYDVKPTNIGNIPPQSFGINADGIILDSFLTNTQDIRVYVYAVTGDKHFKPTVNVNGNNVANLTRVSNGPLFTGYTNFIIPVNATGITATHEDGATHTTLVNWDSIPEVKSAYFSGLTGGTYQNGQTELKAGDTFGIFVSGNTPFTQIELLNSDAFTGQTFTFTSTTSAIISGKIASRTTGTYGAKLKIKKSNGSTSLEHIITGTTNGVNILNLNDTQPTISSITIVYPGVQLALKDNEYANITHTIANANTVTYTDPSTTEQLEITGATITPVPVLEITKTVKRNSGDYNDSTTNFRITATKTSNGAVTVVDRVVNIANVSAKIDVSIKDVNGVTKTGRLRSGGNDNTTSQTYTVIITSPTQLLLEAPEMSVFDRKGTFLDSWSEQNATKKIYTRTLVIHDDDERGLHNFTFLKAKNLAGKITNTFEHSQYDIGGFVRRDNIPVKKADGTFAFGDRAIINVRVSNFDKLPNTLNWVVNLPIKKPITTPSPVADAWTIDKVNNSLTNTTTFLILDTQKTGTYSTSFVSIEEYE